MWKKNIAYKNIFRNLLFSYTHSIVLGLTLKFCFYGMQAKCLSSLLSTRSSFHRTVVEDGLFPK